MYSFKIKTHLNELTEKYIISSQFKYCFRGICMEFWSDVYNSLRGFGGTVVRSLIPKHNYFLNFGENV